MISGSPSYTSAVVDHSAAYREGVVAKESTIEEAVVAKESQKVNGEELMTLAQWERHSYTPQSVATLINGYLRRMSGDVLGVVFGFYFKKENVSLLLAWRWHRQLSAKMGRAMCVSVFSAEELLAFVGGSGSNDANEEQTSISLCRDMVGRGHVEVFGSFTDDASSDSFQSDGINDRYMISCRTAQLFRGFEMKTR